MTERGTGQLDSIEMTCIVLDGPEVRHVDGAHIWDALCDRKDRLAARKMLSYCWGVAGVVDSGRPYALCWPGRYG